MNEGNNKNKNRKTKEANVHCSTTIPITRGMNVGHRVCSFLHLKYDHSQNRTRAHAQLEGRDSRRSFHTGNYVFFVGRHPLVRVRCNVDAADQKLRPGNHHRSRQGTCSRMYMRTLVQICSAHCAYYLNGRAFLAKID